MEAFKSVKTERAAIDSGVIGITREHGRNPHRRHFGVPGNSREGVAAWIFFKAVLTPSDVILMLSWKDRSAAEDFEHRQGRRRYSDTSRPCHKGLRNI